MGKRPRKGPSSDSCSDSDSDPISDSMDHTPSPTQPPPSALQPGTSSGNDPRSSSDHARRPDPSLSADPARSPDPCPSSDLARSYDPRSSSDPARSLDPRLNSAPAPRQPTVERSHDINAEPFLSPCGSYLVVKPCDSTVSFRKINVFWPQKQISAICGSCDVDIEALANGSLVLKTHSRAHTKALLKTTTFCDKQVTVSLHQSRNSCKGTIFAPELRHMTEDEILADLRGDGVTHIRRLTTFRDGQRRDTSLLVLTFDTTSLPEKINIGWLRKDVRVFVPNPLRCYKCQRFGHGSSSCPHSARCSKCGEAPHDGSDCTTLPRCLSCGSSDHLVSSTQCPTWKEEKQICELKAKSNLSYPEARRQVKASKQTPTPGKSYSQAARVKTTSSSTQTEPLAALPPLQLLKPIEPTPVATSNASTESMTIDGDEPTATASQDTEPIESPVVAPRNARQPSAWTKVPLRGPKSDNQRVTDSAHPKHGDQPSGRPSRPPVKISMGRTRSSSLAPRGGAQFKNN